MWSTVIVTRDNVNKTEPIIIVIGAKIMIPENDLESLLRRREEEASVAFRFASQFAGERRRFVTVIF